MKDEISIKVNIADVTYPLRVPIHEEEKVRKAAKLINDHVRTIKDNYNVNDKVNLLSMSALQLANELVYYKEKQWVEDDGLTERAEKLSLRLKEMLKDF